MQKESSIMKAWKLAVVLLVLGTTFICVVESRAGPRCRRGPVPSYFYPAVPVMPRAEETVDLRWKFEANKPFYVQVSTTTDQTMAVAGMDVVQKQKQTIFLRVTPKIKDCKGNWILGVQIIGIRMSIDIGGNKIDYDSTKPQPIGPMMDFFKALQKFNFKVFLAPDMTITGVEGTNEFIREIAKKNPQMEPLLQSILSLNLIRRMFEPVFAPIPQRRVSKGESWRRVSDLDLGPIGSYKTTSRYTYEGKEATLERIKVESRVSYSPPRNNANLPFKIVGGGLNSLPKLIPGEILFDRAMGRVVSASIPTKLEGALTIDIGGTMTVVNLSQLQTVTVEVTEKNPLAK
jgi:hypothetical protein